MRGELLGGCDIVLEMKAAGELGSTVQVRGGVWGGTRGETMRCAGVASGRRQHVQRRGKVTVSGLSTGLLNASDAITLGVVHGCSRVMDEA